MTRTAAAKATAAADALRAWLRDQPPPVFCPRRGAPDRVLAELPPGANDAPVGVNAAGHPAEAAGTGGPSADASSAAVMPDPAPVGFPPAPPAIGDGIEPRTCAAMAPGMAAANTGGAPLRLGHTDWLHHHLTVTGPAAALAAFRAAASGAGIIPWQLDRDRRAEDFFHLLAAPPPPQQRRLSVAGARILAGQLSAAMARRHELALARVGQSQACPFDLQALVPVPETILRRGPDDVVSLEWLWQHWGTTQALRHVADETVAAGEARRRQSGAPAPDMHLSFWSADWSPWRALTQIAACWPALRFDLRPEYDPP
jgi:hypothetical protein